MKVRARRYAQLRRRLDYLVIDLGRIAPTAAYVQTIGSRRA